MSKLCDECETVAHCLKHGCIPKQQALDKKAENARELGLDYEPRAWFTVDELNAWADKKLKENPQWAEQPAQQEPVAELLKQSRENFERNFGKGGQGWADWIYGDIAELLSEYTSPQPAQRPHECSRSHPHENMDAMCELRTEIARLTNENARLKAASPDRRR